MADTLEIFGTEYTNVAGIIAIDDNGNELTYTRGRWRNRNRCSKYYRYYLRYHNRKRTVRGYSAEYRVD